MFDKLEDLLNRYEDVMNELQSPGVTDDQTRFRKLMKERLRGVPEPAGNRARLIGQKKLKIQDPVFIRTKSLVDNAIYFRDGCVFTYLIYVKAAHNRSNFIFPKRSRTGVILQ